MEGAMSMIAFGPVPSRRLGRSLGINNIPPKVCTYSCVYCQLGRTNRMRAARQDFFQAKDILRAVEKKVKEAGNAGESIDYLAFVPDGEPTLDINLGSSIRALRHLNIPVAVVTNSSLLHLPRVREDLQEADWVSVKVDSVLESSWRAVDRPHGSLPLASILRGVEAFAREFSGELQTETMLVQDFNEGEEDLRATAEFLGPLKPAKANLSIPTRPPAEEGVRPPGEAILSLAYGIFKDRVPRVEILSGYEGDAFACSGDARQDILSITAVHPMRESAIRKTLAGAGAHWEVVAELLESGQLVEVEYKGHRYYLRPIAT
jgi:wyosine [tRNA(Phe)-imidazoG37] synthetase (radical SAM superfamily)